MNFLSWFNRNNKKENKEKSDIKNFSDVGIDSSQTNYDIAASTMGIFPTIVGSNSIAGFGGSYGGYFSFQGAAGTFPMYGMHSLCRLYQWMAQDPDVRYAVDEIINEATTPAIGDDIISINLDEIEMPDKLKEKITEEFKNVLNIMDFKNKAHFHFGSFYINGRVFFKLDINPDNIKEGIKAVKLINPFDIISYFDKDNVVFRDPTNIDLKFKEGYILTENAFRGPQYLGLIRPKVAKGMNNYIAVPSDLIIYQHSGLVDWRFNIPISYLQLVLKTLNQLRTLRDAMVIYRMTRAPERFVFNVEVGKMQANKAENYVSQVANRLKQTISYNPETGEFKDVNDSLQIYKDWFFPKVDGHGTEVNVLQSGNMIGQLEEVTAFQKMLFRQLFVPYSRFDEDSGMMRFDATGDIERMEIKFYKFIKKQQIQFNTIFFEILKRQLSFKGIIDSEKFDEYKSKIDFIWGSDNIYNKNKVFGLMTREARMLNEYENLIGKFHITEDWVVKNILGFTDEETKEFDKNIEDDLIRAAWLDAIKTGRVVFDKEGNMISDYSELIPKKPEEENPDELGGEEDSEKTSDEGSEEENPENEISI
jgi:hypothetical protein